MSISCILYIFCSIVLESFPISSSGHCALLYSLFEKFRWTQPINENFDLFLHGPIALVVALFFFKDWFFILKGVPRTLPFIKKIFCYGFITDSITVPAYFLIFKNNTFLPIWLGFLITSLLIFSLKFCPTTRPYSVWNYQTALLLGIVQAGALMPGISRLGSTFVCARRMGFSVIRAFQLSFLIEWPISCAAFLKATCVFYQENKIVELLQLNVILVMIVAMVGGFFGLRLTQRILKEQMEWVFSVYLMMVAIGSFLLV